MLSLFVMTVMLATVTSFPVLPDGMPLPATGMRSMYLAGKEPANEDDQEAGNADTVGREAIDREAVDRDAADQDAVEQGAVEQDAVEQGAVEQDAVEQDAVDQDVVDQDTVEQDVVDQDAVEQDAGNEDVVDQDTVDQDAIDQAYMIFGVYPRRSSYPLKVDMSAKMDWLSKEINQLRELDEYDDEDDVYQPTPQKVPGTSNIFDIFNIKPNYNTQTKVVSALKEEVKQNDDMQDKQEADSDMEFAADPLEEEYYSKKKVPPLAGAATVDAATVTPVNDGARLFLAKIAPRKTRQNPNLSKTKNLVMSDIETLKKGLDEVKETTTLMSEDYFLDGLRIEDDSETVYAMLLFGAICGTSTFLVVAIAIIWYIFLKRAKAAANVDYPAYGVTGPTMENPGDRKLAQSAHMYHFQHQKHQIIAMER